MHLTRLQSRLPCCDLSAVRNAFPLILLSAPEEANLRSLHSVVGKWCASQVADEVVRQLTAQHFSAANTECVPELLAGFLARYETVMAFWKVGPPRSR